MAAEFKVSVNRQAKPQPRRFVIVPDKPLKPRAELKPVKLPPRSGVVNRDPYAKIEKEYKPGTKIEEDWLDGVGEKEVKPEPKVEKKEKKHEVVVYKEKKPTKLRQERLEIYKKDRKAWENAETLFGDRATEIMERIEADDREGVTKMLYQELMRMMVDLVPIIEKGVRATKGFRGVRSLNEMVSQIRELIADMQAVQDKGMLGQTIVARYVRPAFLDIAMQMVTSNARILAEVLPYVDEKSREKVSANMKGAEKELAKYIQAQYNNIAENIVKGLT